MKEGKINAASAKPRDTALLIRRKKADSYVNVRISNFGRVSVIGESGHLFEGFVRARRLNVNSYLNDITINFNQIITIE